MMEGNLEMMELLSAAASPRETSLVVLGDSNDPRAFSGTPYHFLQAAKRAGVIQRGVPLPIGGFALRWERRFWNLQHVLKGHRPGGYQYSTTFLERVWRDAGPAVRGGRVINHFPLYADSVVRDDSVDRWFYIDGTLRQLYDYYGDRIDPRWERAVIARERTGYQRATGIFTMSQFAADSVIRDYGVDPAKVFAIVPGANLTLEEFEAHEKAAVQWRDADTGRRLDESSTPLRLVFVGRDPIRKGLDRLLRALQLGRPQGLTATLRVIGLDAHDMEPSLRQIPGVEWLGLISRRNDGPRLLRLISECDVGCLLSKAEFSSIALREYLAMGLIVLGPRTGGCPELVLPEASVLIAPEIPDEEITRQLLLLEQDIATRERLRAHAWSHRREAMWENSVRQVAAIFAGVGG